MSNPQNYMVHVNCPHCSKHHVVAISGFGGELATREKYCSECKKPYIVHLVAQTTADSLSDQVIRDGQIRAVRDRIKWLQAERKKTLAELLIQQEICQTIYRESLETARKMRDSYGSN